MIEGLKQYNGADIKTISILVDEMIEDENITLQDVVTSLLNERGIELDLDVITDDTMEFNNIKRVYR